MAALGVQVELARLHVLDHAQTQFTDGLGPHDLTPVLDEVDEASIQTTGALSPLSLCSQMVTLIQALARSGYRASDLVRWRLSRLDLLKTSISGCDPTRS
jgi:hypothetical protein